MESHMTTARLVHDAPMDCANSLATLHSSDDTFETGTS